MMGIRLPVHWHSGSEILDTNQFVDEPGKPRRYTRHDLPPGSALLKATLGGKPYLTFTCPCGCGVVATLPLAPMMPGEKGWQWDGDRVFPTLSPPIQKRGCGWHGHLVKGVWQEIP